MVGWRFAHAVALLHLSVIVSAETQVKWTPNEESQGPLPLSQRQRQHLLQLDQTIQNSPDPQATLRQAAAANQMDPNELALLLQRNRQDLQQLGPMPRSRNVWKTLSSLGVVWVQAATKHPRSFSLVMLSLLLALYIAVSMPRTGLVLSSRRSVFSKGPTTLLQPPHAYVQHTLAHAKDWRKPSSGDDHISQLAALMVVLDNDGSIWHAQLKKQNLRQAASAQTTLRNEDFIASGAEDENDGDELQDLMMEHASDVIATRKLTEFSGSNLRFIVPTSGKKLHGILVVPGMGDWGRFGLLPLTVTNEKESSKEVSLTLTVPPGEGHWDGQIHVSIAAKGSGVRIRVHLVVPPKGHKVSKSLAMSLVKSLCDSISSSIATRTRQSLARRSQSSRFQGKAKERASDRRQSRFDKERQLEEMAADRRRRWQRQNPNSGHYRPSGDRLKSPNNAVY